MVSYVTRRFAVFVPTLLGVIAVVFLLVRLVPGDPALTLVGENASPAQIENARRYLNLDRPLWEQFTSYLGNLATGNLGTTVLDGRPVLDEFLRRFAATLELTAAAMVFAVTAGLVLGVYAARHPNGWIDAAIGVTTLAGVSIPIFVSGLFLQYLFAVQLEWLPASGRIDPRLSLPVATNLLVIDSLLAGRLDALGDVAAHLILPAITLGSLPLAIIARMARATYLDTSRRDYVRTAKSKGISDREVSRRHIMRNAWLPIVTVIGLQVGILLAGAVLTETVFSWNGVGSWVVRAIKDKDYAVVQSSILLFAAVFLVINLIVDLSYAYLDPRIRYR